MDKPVVYTVGYSGFGNDIDAFIRSLQFFGITALIDVRSTPYSSFFTAFNKEALEASLNHVGIVYRNYAKEFGARQEDKCFYPHGYLDFELFAQSSPFQEGIAKVVKGINTGYVFALMCSEKEPVTCHRTILVARAFSELDYEIKHILPDNGIKTQKAIEDELLALYPRTLFDDESIDDVTLAYQKQNQKIGFKVVDL